MAALHQCYKGEGGETSLKCAFDGNALKLLTMA